MPKSKNINNKNENKKDEAKMNPDIKGVIYIGIGILLAIAIYTSFAGALSYISKMVIYRILGVASFTIPVYLIYYGYNTIVSKGNVKWGKRFYGILTLVVIATLACATASVNILQYNDGFYDSWTQIVQLNGINGGLLGHLIAYPLSTLIGYIGSYILYLVLFIIGVMMTSDLTLYDIGTFFAKEKESIKDNKIKSSNNEKVKKIEDAKRDEGSKFKNKKANMIDVVPKQSDEDLKNEDNKVKILDFMNSSDHKKKGSLKDFIAVDKMKSGAKPKATNPFNIEIFDNNDSNNSIEHTQKIDIMRNIKKEEKIHIIGTPMPKEQEKKEEKSKVINLEKVDNKVKDVVSKEIEEDLNEEKIEEKLYNYPELNLLNINNKTKINSEDKKELIESAGKLDNILGDFGVDAKVTQVTKGPSVTRFEIQPSPGVKVSKIVNLQDDIALGLAASAVRMEAPIPGKAAIGIEVPNSKQTAVFLREVLESDEFKASKKKLAFALGKDIAGKSVVGDLSTMPHMLIAGATGSGKSVCINTLIVSLLYKYNSDEVKLLMIDPKVVELSVYNGIPHLLIPVVTDPKKAAAALNWAVNEMDRRYKLFADIGTRNIENFNALYEKGTVKEKLPYIVMIVDELADLMMTCPNDVEDYICRLAQKARAAGMHLIIATQRPSVDVITGVIKANIPSRISFAVSSGIDSRTILDSTGAEKLLGRGDMLYCPIGENKPLRVQGAFISEEEVENVVNFVKQDSPNVDYQEAILEHIENGSSDAAKMESLDGEDELLEEVIKVVIEYNQASTSFIQRKFRVGFNRASRIMDELEDRGIISERDGSRPRQVLISKEEFNIED